MLFCADKVLGLQYIETVFDRQSIVILIKPGVERGD
jgi:hypothetical protein